MKIISRCYVKGNLTSTMELDTDYAKEVYSGLFYPGVISLVFHYEDGSRYEITKSV